MNTDTTVLSVGLFIGAYEVNLIVLLPMPTRYCKLTRAVLLLLLQPSLRTGMVSYNKNLTNVFI